MRAQQDVAEWAFAGFIVSAFGLLLNLVGVWFVVAALRLNADATKAATAQAKTAESQLAALEELERPYLFASVEQEEAPFKPIGAVKGALGPSEFDTSDTTAFSFINHGRSPAILVAFNRRRYSRFASEGLPPPLIAAANPGFNVPHGVAVAVGHPSQKFRVQGEFATPTQSEPRDEHDYKTAFLIGFVVYRNTLGQHYRTGFAYEWSRWDKRWYIVSHNQSPDYYNYDVKADPPPPRPAAG